MSLRPACNGQLRAVGLRGRNDCIQAFIASLGAALAAGGLIAAAPPANAGCQYR
jgi:hypothetical protein